METQNIAIIMSMIFGTIGMITGIWSLLIKQRDQNWIQNERNKLSIEYPHEIVTTAKEYVRIKGRSGKRWDVIFLITLTDRCYLQSDSTAPLRDGSWIIKGCHLKKSAVGKHRYVAALAVSKHDKSIVRDMFRDDRNKLSKNHIMDFGNLEQKLDEKNIKYQLSSPRLLIQKLPDEADSSEE